MQRPSADPEALSDASSTCVATTRSVLLARSGIVSPGRMSGTALLIVGGSAGVPSARTSLNVKVIRPPFPGPDGEPSLSQSGGGLDSGREGIALAVLLAVADRPSVGERRRPADVPVQALPRMREDDTPRIEGQGAAAQQVR
jgi:hypothetical protein